MEAFRLSLVAALVLVMLVAVRPAQSQLTDNFYYSSCPKALEIIKSVVERAVNRDRRMGASLLRLHFHDCFVNGCDGSILLDDTDSMVGEKTSPANMNSARGFELIDEIKEELDRTCGCVVSCADILAVASRDSVVLLGGESYKVEMGRRDSLRANKDEVLRTVPAPDQPLQQLIDSFTRQGLSAKDLVVLSGAHTVGAAQCQFAKRRLNGGGEIDASFANRIRNQCPAPAWSDSKLVTLDDTAERFDNDYFKDLVNKRGLLQSDQQLVRVSGGETDQLVRRYANDQNAFWKDFGESMLKMGRIKVLTGNNGEIRENCRRVNY